MSCIWVAIPVDWIILHRYACGKEGRSLARCTVTWLPNFLGWVDYHISLAMGLRALSSANETSTPIKFIFGLSKPLVPPSKCLINYFLFIDLWLFTGGSVYRVGLQKAFDLSKASAVGESDKTKRRIILFLTASDPTDDKGLIFKTRRDRNLELNNSVIIFTFGIDTPNPEILTDIAIKIQQIMAILEMCPLVI